MVSKALVCEVPYLNNPHARVKEDGSFGFFGGVFIFVEVEVVRAISKLSQMKVPSLEGLEDENRECYHLKLFLSLTMKRR